MGESSGFGDLVNAIAMHSQLAKSRRRASFSPLFKRHGARDYMSGGLLHRMWETHQLLFTGSVHDLPCQLIQ